MRMRVCLAMIVRMIMAAPTTSVSVIMRADCFSPPGEKLAELSVQQPDSNQRHETPADGLDPAFRRRNFETGGAKRNRKNTDDGDRRKRLNECPGPAACSTP